MLDIALIYAAALGLLLLVGVAAGSVIRLGDLRVDYNTLPLGAVVLIALAFPLGFLFTASVLAPVIVVVAVLTIATTTVLRRSRRRVAESREARSRRSTDLAVLALGIAAGIVLLLPLFALGFPSTIASGIADGWARSVFIEWLLDDPLRDARTSVGDDRPIGSYSGVSAVLGLGFEYFASIVATLSGRLGYEVALPVAATAAPLALCGWVRLWAEVTERRPDPQHAVFLAIAVASPLFLLGFVDNYLTQFFSLALWPFAVATSLAFFRSWSARTGIVAAIAVAAVIGVYPQLAPWLFVGVVGIAYGAHGRGPRRLERIASPRVRRLGIAACGLIVLGVAVLAVGPIEIVRAYQALTIFVSARSNAAFPLYEAQYDLGLLLGAFSQFSLETPPTTGDLLARLGLMLSVVAIAALALVRLPPRIRGPLIATGLSVAALTAVVFAKSKWADAYGYGAYKALLYGGAPLTGLLLVALSAPSLRLRSARVAAAFMALAVWVPVSAVMLQRQHDGAQGFREGERDLQQALERLPDDDAVLLVAGASETPTSVRLRMAAGYFALALDRRTAGLGTTRSYMTGGGSAAWRPARPWRYVLTAPTGPSPFGGHRRAIEDVPPFRLAAAPALDVTPYPAPTVEGTPHTSWLPAAPDHPTPLEYVAGPAMLVVSNRTGTPVTARLRLKLSAVEAPRSLRLSATGSDPATYRIDTDRQRWISYEVRVDARATGVVSLDPATARPLNGPATPLLALTATDVERSDTTTRPTR